MPICVVVLWSGLQSTEDKNENIIHMNRITSHKPKPVDNRTSEWIGIMDGGVRKAIPVPHDSQTACWASPACSTQWVFLVFLIKPLSLSSPISSLVPTRFPSDWLPHAPRENWFNPEDTDLEHGSLCQGRQRQPVTGFTLREVFQTVQ